MGAIPGGEEKSWGRLKGDVGQVEDKRRSINQATRRHVCQSHVTRAVVCSSISLCVRVSVPEFRLHVVLVTATRVAFAVEKIALKAPSSHKLEIYIIKTLLPWHVLVIFSAYILPPATKNYCAGSYRISSFPLKILKLELVFFSPLLWKKNLVIRYFLISINLMTPCENYQSHVPSVTLAPHRILSSSYTSTRLTWYNIFFPFDVVTGEFDSRLIRERITISHDKSSSASPSVFRGHDIRFAETYTSFPTLSRCKPNFHFLQSVEMIDTSKTTRRSDWLSRKSCEGRKL